jgi:hypothetical protein
LQHTCWQGSFSFLCQWNKASSKLKWTRTQVYNDFRARVRAAQKLEPVHAEHEIRGQGSNHGNILYRNRNDAGAARKRKKTRSSGMASTEASIHDPVQRNARRGSSRVKHSGYWDIAESSSRRQRSGHKSGRQNLQSTWQLI